MTLDDLQELFEDADKKIEDGLFTKAKNILETIVEEDPSFGKAHNHLGWLKEHKYNDLVMAEKHYQLAIQFDSYYSPTYFNYVYLLRKQDRYEEALVILQKSVKIPTVYKPDLHNEFGYTLELQEQYEPAIIAYQVAIRSCLDSDKIEVLEKDIQRCKKKITASLSFWQRIKRRFK